MSLLARIDQDVKQAMIAKNQEKLDTLRFLKSDLKYAALEKHKAMLDDAEILQVIQKQIKKRRESIEQFTKGGRQDLADKESREVVHLEVYVPTQISDQELESVVRKKIQEAAAVSKKDFGRMMKILNTDLAGQADAKRISDQLGKMLQ